MSRTKHFWIDEAIDAEDHRDPNADFEHERFLDRQVLDDEENADNWQDDGFPGEDEPYFVPDEATDYE